MDYLRYYLGVVMQLTGIAGILAGGGWAWLGVAQLPLFALLDPLIGEDERERNVASDTLMDVPVVICSLLGPVVVAVLAWKVGRGGLTSAEIAGVIASGAGRAVVPGGAAPPRRSHKRGAWKYAAGRDAHVAFMGCD